MEKIRWEKMVEDTKKFFASPIELYQNFEKEGGYLEPIIYATVMTFITELILVLFLSIFHLKPLFLGISIITLIFFIPFFLISFFISTAILHFIWTILGSNESFETSLRCSASFSPLVPAIFLVSFIPFFGKWLGMLAYIFALCFYIILASVYVHGIEETKARKVFVTIAVIIASLNIIGIIRGEIKERKVKKESEEIMRKLEEKYQKQMEEYEKIMQEQQKMYEEYQKQIQQNQPQQDYSGM